MLILFLIRILQRYPSKSALAISISCVHLRGKQVLKDQDFRKRLKEQSEKYEHYQAKERERKKAERDKPKNLGLSEVERRKRLKKERVTRCKLQKKVAARAESENSTYKVVCKTPQALGKAVGKVMCHLPESLRKRKAIVIKLASDQVIDLSMKNRRNWNSWLSAEAQETSSLFCYLNSVSRQSPGRRDFIINRIHGKREYMQKRHLVCSLKETHALFQNEHPDIKVDLSKFPFLRPMNFLLPLIYQEMSFYVKWHVLIKEFLSKPPIGRYLKGEG